MPALLPSPTISQTVFRTPLVRLQRILPPECAEIVLKAESFNPMASVKDRIAEAMIRDAELNQGLDASSTIVEATSGNTGIALAFLAASRGYRLILAMPESMSLERRHLLQSLGAELVLTPKELGMKGAIAKAEEIAAETPRSWQPRQFENPMNPRIHERTTGPEIWEATQAGVDAIVTGVGTGGTITGITRFIRFHKPAFQAWAVEPEASPVLSGGAAGPHPIQGIGAGFVPRNLERGLLSGVLTVSAEESMHWARRLAREEGIFAGISTGANLAASIKLGQRPEWRQKTIVTMWCSFGERYLSTPLYSESRDESLARSA